MISFLVVNYRSENRLGKCLTSIGVKADGIKYEVVLVNNDPQEITSLKEKPGLKIIEVNRNVGFGTACNLGVRQTKGDLLCFLNPDAEILSKNIRSVIEKFDSDPKLGVLGARLLTEDGKVQEWSAGKETGLFDIILNNLGFARSSRIWKSGTPKQSDWVSGAAFFIRKDLFSSLNGFNEAFFMYFEDMDLCKRVSQAGFKILHYPFFEVFHKGGGSFRGNKEQKKLYYESQDLYFRKHRGAVSLYILKFLRLFS
ncbi:MAG: Glycosyl transferase family 2 [Candidatus Moranbacteria bacterium GW2011_GWE1_49_15]|nr:MAG: Glycosyl transferase family 2 [Candidatus Moranbacteria bacterium GW2011_GWE2_47_10]KKW07343.1 MAG: Glycosyl transferase family 2 [Candidatus Moranbacteria bacterium GW2011_GWE1_49_15]